MMPFFCIYISQCSVATCLKRGGIFKHEFVANLLSSRLVKKIKNRIIVSEVMARSLVSCFFDSRYSFAVLGPSRRTAKNAAYYYTGGVVCLCVCLCLLVTSVSGAKTAKSTEMSFEVSTRGAKEFMQ